MTAVLEVTATATALATAALGVDGPDRILVAALLAELPDVDRAEVVTQALVFAAVGGQVRCGVALDVAASRATDERAAP